MSEKSMASLLKFIDSAKMEYLNKKELKAFLPSMPQVNTVRKNLLARDTVAKVFYETVSETYCGRRDITANQITKSWKMLTGIVSPKDARALSKYKLIR
eukprot:TRINITY_DN3668_c0_g1_i1.p1 TRINITY_DN3668_c0_g1~~TRINITY_DN3668_c0_g1_i1.p1  ORF type:complete len:99 (+),score=12.58 TRINITY_DN3668_c0_g1_i1:201-497(+)